MYWQVFYLGGNPEVEFPETQQGQSNRGPVSRDVEEDTTIKRRDLRNKTKVAVC
jgi:hypothetical protein